MRRVGCFIFVAILACSTWANAQDARLELENKLEAQFVPTKITADRTDIVTAGSILLLHKDGLLMFSIDTKVPPTVSYKDGKLSMGLGAIMATDFALGQAQPGSNHSTVPQRKFVAGEKIWYVSSSVKDDGVLFMVYSDVYQDVRYYGLLKFPFAKKVIPPADELLKTIAEVVTVEPGDNAAGNSPQPSPGPPPPPSALKPIPAPPPPADSTPPPQSRDSSAPPPTIALGQTKDQVLATFGQPQKIVSLGSKEIDYYPDMKVTFVNGKVTDVDVK